MTQEEKAKAYDDAIERARIWKDKSGMPKDKQGILDDIFPELKESEDEKIREEILEYFQQFENEELRGVDISDWIAWLEKQGEKKPNPYSGTSFEYNGHTWGMCARDNGVEITIDSELKAFVSLDKSFIYPIRNQPIIAPKSAKEALNEEKVDNANKVEPKDYNGIDPHFGKPADKVESFDRYEGLTDFERTLADICIGWIGEELGWKQYIKDNADVLLKIAVKKFNSVQDAPFEQKPAWSEEDKVMLDEIIDFFENETVKLQHDLSLYASWLKSFKNRYTWKPSDEQIEALEHFVRSVGESGYASPYDNNTKLLYLLLEQLKKLREK